LGLIKLLEIQFIQSVNIIIKLGGIVVEYEPEQMNFDGFGSILSADMKVDLPNYLNKYASDEITIRSISEIIAYNNDPLVRIPYGKDVLKKCYQKIVVKKNYLLKARIKRRCELF
jgi:amidase